MPATAPRMAAANTLYPQPTPAQRSMSFDRFQGVFRTTRRVTTPRERPQNARLHRRKHPPIHSHAKNQNALCRAHSPIFNNPAFLNAVKKSFSTSPKLFPAMTGRATSTRSSGWANSCWCSRNASRISRRARFLTTAPPTLRDVITPSRVRASGLSLLKFAIRQPVTSLWPCWRILAKSRPCLIRCFLENRCPPGFSALKQVSTACVRRAADCAEWRGRFWSSCGSKSRVAACGEFSRVGIVVS